MGKKLIDPDRMCMGCMEPLEDPEKPCPKCGFLLWTYQQPQNSMPPYEIINGKYLIGKVIGMGGFGITYIGWDFYQSRRVCIKEYFPRGVAARDPGVSVSDQYSTYSMNVFTQNTEKAKHAYMGGLQSYIKEAELLSKFYIMPGIVSVRDFFYGNHTAYIVMEYIEGINLRQFAKRVGGVIEPELLFRMLRDVICALNAVHKEGIVHRDISPDNIMINRSYQAKVIDFGAAKNYDGVHDNAVFLKHGYAPVEQYDRKGNQGPWTDVYSLCATIYYLLSGVKVQRAYERVENDMVKPIGSLGCAVSDRQQNAIMKGLSVEPEMRCQSMAELYYHLYQEYMPGETPSVKAEEMNRAENMKSTEEAALDYLRQHMDEN